MEETQLSDSFKNLMVQYDWPGNVRELENLMRRLLVYQDEKMIFGDLERAIEHSRHKARPVLPVAVETPEQAPSLLQAPQLVQTLVPSIASMTDLAEVARQAEAKLLLDALERTHWNRRQAAASLNLDYKAFLYKLQKLGLVEKKDKASVPQTV